MNTKKTNTKNQPNNMDTDSYFGSIFFFQSQTRTHWWIPKVIQWNDVPTIHSVYKKLYIYTRIQHGAKSTLMNLFCQFRKLIFSNLIQLQCYQNAMVSLGFSEISFVACIALFVQKELAFCVNNALVFLKHYIKMLSSSFTCI